MADITPNIANVANRIADENETRPGSGVAFLEDILDAMVTPMLTREMAREELGAAVARQLVSVVRGDLPTQLSRAGKSKVQLTVRGRSDWYGFIRVRA